MTFSTSWLRESALPVISRSNAVMLTRQSRGPVGTRFSGAKSLEQINILSDQNPNYTVGDLAGTTVDSVFLGLTVEFQTVNGSASLAMVTFGSTGTVSVDGTPLDDQIDIAIQNKSDFREFGNRAHGRTGVGSCRLGRNSQLCIADGQRPGGQRHDQGGAWS